MAEHEDPMTTRESYREAAGWLSDYLTANGGTASSADAKRDGVKAGHSQKVIRRARERLGVTVESSGFPRATWWTLPEPQPCPQSCPPVVPISRGEGTTDMTDRTGHYRGHDFQHTPHIRHSQQVRRPADARTDRR